MNPDKLLYHLAAAAYVKEAMGPGMPPQGGVDPMANMVPPGVGVKAPPGTGNASTDIHQVLGDAVARGGSANIKIDGAPKVQAPQQLQPPQQVPGGPPTQMMGAPQPQGSPVNMAGQAPAPKPPGGGMM